MKKNKTVWALLMLFSSGLFFSSCVGSFSLFNHLRSWNQTVSDKFVNELIFLSMHIVPVYEAAYLADALVINSIEFWSGSNPLANIGDIKKVKGDNGEYWVTTIEDGYRIKKVGEKKTIELVYDKELSTWCVVSNNETTELVKINKNGTADLILPNKQRFNVTLDHQGVMAAKEIASMSPLFVSAK
ncbi:MAG: DUF3332 domain-containing protein [Bacteroidia bacterium]|nr:DUF3332 domain-containing protein [Bacteroidia bacterium]